MDRRGSRGGIIDAIRAGLLTLKMTPSFIRAHGTGLRAWGSQLPSRLAWAARLERRRIRPLGQYDLHYRRGGCAPRQTSRIPSLIAHADLAVFLRVESEGCIIGLK